MTAFPSLRRLNVSYTLVHVIYWALFAVFAGYQTSLLLGRGFTSGEAGVFASIRCFAGILAQPLLGGWADRHPEVPIKRLLNVCLVLALGVNGVFYATRPGFWGTAVIFLALGILEDAGVPYLLKEPGSGEYLRLVTGENMFGTDLYVPPHFTHRALRLLHRFDHAADEPFDEGTLEAAVDAYEQDYGPEPQDDGPVTPEGYRMVFVFLAIFAVLAVVAIMIGR